MDARIVDATPFGGPPDVRIWQIETLRGGKPHREHSGKHTSTDPEVLRATAKSEGLNIVEDESR